MFSQIFVNLPVANLKRSVDFFTGMGFTFNPKFTNEQSTCMIVSEHIYVMLLERDVFASFIPKPIAPAETTEAILSFACTSTEQVRELSEKAFALGAKQINEPDDKGFMFSWGFEDLDGHLWDLFWMDPAALEG
jgi:predicted lactoylglutathione lyase